jgi:hypothetical protein
MYTHPNKNSSEKISLENCIYWIYSESVLGKFKYLSYSVLNTIVIPPDFLQNFCLHLENDLYPFGKLRISKSSILLSRKISWHFIKSSKSGNNSFYFRPQTLIEQNFISENFGQQATEFLPLVGLS